MMVLFYTTIIESILTSSITIWYAAATAKDKSRLQRIIRTAEKVIGCILPTSRTLRRARKIVADSSHPGHSGRRLAPLYLLFIPLYLSPQKLFRPFRCWPLQQGQGFTLTLMILITSCSKHIASALHYCILYILICSHICIFCIFIL